MYWNLKEWDGALISGRVEKEQLVLLKAFNDDQMDWNDYEKRQFEVVTNVIVEPPNKEAKK